MEMFRVLRAGSFTTVQDLGRFGYQQFGVPPSGALDEYSLRVANILVGNEENRAVLEITIQGPRLEVLAPASVVMTGAEMDLSVNGNILPGWASFQVRPGDVLNMGQARRGCRAYLAITGGIDVPLVMGSRSTYTTAAMGGYQGRPLNKGDVILRGEGTTGHESAVCPELLIPRLPNEIKLRAIPGPQDDLFNSGRETLFGSAYQVSLEANRMGYRLEGPAVMRRQGAPASIISEPSLPGGVQIPPDGRPIILLVEQTVGGYAKIATVISTDISRLAQAKPGDLIRFEETTLEEAYVIYREKEESLKALREHFLPSKVTSGSEMHRV